LIIDAVDIFAESHSASPGRVIDWHDQGIVVGTSTDDLVVRKLRLKNGPAMGSMKEIIQWLGIRRGDCFESSINA
jgi:hypothetical protein